MPLSRQTFSVSARRAHYLADIVNTIFTRKIPEPRFKRNEKSRQISTHPDLEGVYELGVPLEMRAVLNLGCVVKVLNDVAKQRRRNKKKFKNQPFALNDLEFLTQRSMSTLTPPTRPTHTVAYMFHSDC